MPREPVSNKIMMADHDKQDVEFWYRGKVTRKAEHGLVHCICPLLTQSGHGGPFQRCCLIRYDVLTEPRGCGT